MQTEYKFQVTQLYLGKNYAIISKLKINHLSYSTDLYLILPLLLNQLSGLLQTHRRFHQVPPNSSVHCHLPLLLSGILQAQVLKVLHSIIIPSHPRPTHQPPTFSSTCHCSLRQSILFNYCYVSQLSQSLGGYVVCYVFLFCDLSQFPIMPFPPSAFFIIKAQTSDSPQYVLIKHH